MTSRLARLRRNPRTRRVEWYAHLVIGCLSTFALGFVLGNELTKRYELLSFEHNESLHAQCTPLWLLAPLVACLACVIICEAVFFSTRHGPQTQQVPTPRE